jgi:hypothetical protein
MAPSTSTIGAPRPRALRAMSPTPDLWLLPGMDGTGRLYARLVQALAQLEPAWSPRVVSYDERATT